MIHKRLRPFNTKDTYPEQKLNTDLRQGVVARGTWSSCAVRSARTWKRGNACMSAIPASRRKKAMQNIKMLLEEAGSEMAHICRIVVYLTDIRYREAVYLEMGKWLKGVHPCSTGLVVDALARPEWVVEVEVTAVIPDEA